MPTITIPTFRGMTPRTHERLLSVSQAQVAENCRLSRGTLEALRSPGPALASAHGSRTLFRHPSLGWLSWPGAVDVVRSSLADSGGHFFLAGDGAPRQGTTLLGGATRPLGVHRPGRPVEIRLEGVPGKSVARSSSYCYTYVMDMGPGGMQESAPSPPTGVFDVLTGQRVVLSGFAPPSQPGVSLRRIYRTVSGTWHFVAEQSVSVSSYTDETGDSALSSETLSTDGWDSPPADVRGMLLSQNGMYVMFRDNEILLSEPFVPYAYPEKYRLGTQDRIVGLGFMDTAVVALTTTRPILLQGSTPESVTMQPLPFDQPCVSRRSIASVPAGVMYASPDGLCLISQAGPDVVTRGLFTRDQWRGRAPENMLGVFFEGCYYGFFQDSGRGLIYDTESGDVREFALPWAVSAAYHDAERDALCLAAGGQVRAFDSGSPLVYRWRSPEFFTSALVLPAVIRVEGEQSSGAPVTARLYAGDVLRHEVTIADTDPVRLPMSGRAEKEWTLELSGTPAVYEVRVATSIEELEHGV